MAQKLTTHVLHFGKEHTGLPQTAMRVRRIRIKAWFVRRITAWSQGLIRRAHHLVAGGPIILSQCHRLRPGRIRHYKSDADVGPHMFTLPGGHQLHSEGRCAFRWVQSCFYSTEPPFLQPNEPACLPVLKSCNELEEEVAGACMCGEEEEVQEVRELILFCSQPVPHGQSLPHGQLQR